MVKQGVPLRDAALPSLSSNAPGVYILYLDGRIMKVGSAEIGIQKRMQQYYGLNPYCGLNEFISVNNRDRIRVSYQVCPQSACRELESKLFDKYGPVSSLPWTKRRPVQNTDVYTLYI